MRNKLFFGLIGVMLIIGLAFISCDPESDSKGSNGTTTSPFEGTWNKSPDQLIISGQNWEVKVSGTWYSKGSYTFNESTKKMTITTSHAYVSGWQAIPAEMVALYTAHIDYNLSGNTLTISNNDNETDMPMNGTWTR
jgi:hypothetical protein